MATVLDTHVFRAFAPTLRDTGLPAGVIGQVAGIALVYDVIDSYGSTFARGSLDRTMRERIAAGKVKLFWDHGDAMANEGMYDSDLHIGTVRSLQDVQMEDGGWGAYMVADLFDTPKGREAKQYLQSVLGSGGQTGLSVGGLASGVKSSVVRIDGVKVERITEFPIREISITSMQAVPDSEVMAVRMDTQMDAGMGDPMAVAAAKIQAAIEIHTGHMASDGPPSKESEEEEMALLQGALAALQGEGAEEKSEPAMTMAAREAIADGTVVITTIIDEKQDRPSLEAAFKALLHALPHDVIRAQVGAVLGNATTNDSDAPGPTPVDSHAEAEDSRTTPVVFATMDERLLAVRSSYAKAA